MTSELVTVVQSNRAGALQPRHSRNQIWVGSFHHQMVMVSHETEGMNLPVGFSASFGKGLQEIVAVHIAEENILALISSAHDMIHCTGKFQSHLAWHRQR